MTNNTLQGADFFHAVAGMKNAGKFSRRMVWLLAMLGSLGVAVAQIGELEVPDMPLPPLSVPGVQTPDGGLVGDAANAADRTLRRLARVRALQVEQLAREHRAELDRDDQGELVVRAEVIGIDMTDAALQRALAAQFLLRRTRELADLGVRISVLQAPEGWSAARGLKQLRKLDPGGSYDFNHVYLSGGESAAPALPSANTPAAPGAAGRVGLIDGGVDLAHRVFQNVRLEHSGCDGQVIPSTHGTAVAAILATHPGIEEVFAADVYCNAPTGGAVDAVATALGWLARSRVAVINVSLVGPRNTLLERSVAALVARGFLIVAAVGNDGPAAPPLYPASYPGVIGVTGVDAKHRVLVEAARGEQVDFAARGADMRAASAGPDTYAAVRGTSFAAPIVASILAAELDAPDVARRESVISKWAATAQDLGKRGRDDVYGAGELGDLPPPVADSANK
jgi:subtilase family protein